MSNLPRSRPARRSTRRPTVVRAEPSAPAAGGARVSPPPSGYAVPRSADPACAEDQDPLSTAVQAAGELARIGLAVGRLIVRSALTRLPKP